MSVWLKNRFIDVFFLSSSLIRLYVSLCFLYARAHLFLLGNWPSNVQWRAKSKRFQTLTAAYMWPTPLVAVWWTKAAPSHSIISPRDPDWSRLKECMRKWPAEFRKCSRCCLACADYDLGVVRSNLKLDQILSGLLLVSCRVCAWRLKITPV